MPGVKSAKKFFSHRIEWAIERKSVCPNTDTFSTSEIRAANPYSVGFACTREIYFCSKLDTLM